MAVWSRLTRRKTEAKSVDAAGVRRLKRYHAASGYAYQYYFDGERGRPRCKEYCFQVVKTEGAYRQILARLPDGIVLSWELNHSRTLSSQELYGIAKLLFFSYLDNMGPESSADSSATLTESDLERISTELDFE